MTQPTVLISYSQKDKEKKDTLLAHLGVLKQAGLIDLWSDDDIGAGADKEEELHKAIEQAEVAILLISANFLTSKKLENNLSRFLNRHRAGNLIIVPIIAKPCTWHRVEWLAEMSVRPKNGHPVWSDKGSHADDDLTMIVDEVANICKDIEKILERNTSIATRQQPELNNLLTPNTPTIHGLWPSEAVFCLWENDICIKKFSIREGATHLIGKSSRCQFQIDPNKYQAVSRRHARIKRIKENVIILDGDGVSSSRHGTYVNGLMVDNTSGIVLSHGDQIVLGGFSNLEKQTISEYACLLTFEWQNQINVK